MKYYVDFFRIKVILIIAIIVLPIVFGVMFINTFTMADFGDYEPRITYENAPENTAYVDILVRLPEGSENYVNFARWTYPPQKSDAALSITPDSEIARLNEDGYVSLSVHYRGCTGFSDNAYLLLSEKMTITDIKKRYGSFKAAFVDENGNVLGITKASRTRYNTKRPSSFSVSGDTLIFTEWGISPLQHILLLVSCLGEPLAVSALVVCTSLEKRQNKQLRSDEKV